MRKFITMALMAAVAVPTVAALPAAASAQSRAEIRRDRQDVRQERRDVRQAQRYGTRQDVRRERQDLRGARQELREDRADRRYGRYVAPYRGWNYSRIGVGYQLRPNFYSQRYFYSGYSGYPAGRFQQWVRYGDDLVLVNVRTGRVLRVVYNYFW